MATQIPVWQCTQGGAVVAELSGKVHPVCSNGYGSYVLMDQPATQAIDWNTVVWATGAGVLMWTAGIAVGLIIAVIRRGRI